MPQNTTANATPIFAANQILGNVQAMTAADTTRGADLSGANVRLLLTAGTDGAIFQYVRALALGTNVQTVLRLFLNNGGALNVAANNVLIAELVLPASNIIENNSQSSNDVVLNMPVPAGFRLYATLGTAVVGGYGVTAIGMNF